MKSLAIISIALASAAFANTNEPITLSTPVNKIEIRTVELNNHELSFGPDVFWQYFNEEKANTGTKSNGAFGGARLRYEYVKPDAFYAGTDAMFAAGGVTDRVEILGIGSDINRTSLAANLEQRLGYTIGLKGLHRASIAPFAGLGWYYSRPVADKQFSNEFVYATAGIKSTYEVTNNFVMGLTGKALYSFFDRTHVAGVSNSTWNDVAWGFEVDVPMTWHLNMAHTWNMTFEPYIQDLDVANNYMNVGGRLLASYHF